MLKKIISGCQTGADIAAIDAAIDNGFPYGGWVPKGRRTEAGPLPLTYAGYAVFAVGFVLTGLIWFFGLRGAA